MAESVAFAFFGKLSEFLVAPIVRHVSYPFCYNSNIKNLRNKIEALENIQGDVQLSIDAAKRNLEVIGRDVEAWLTEVDTIKIVAGRFLEGIDNLGKGCLNRWDPKNLKKRHSLSRKAAKQTEVVLKLQVKGNMYTMLSYPAPPPQIASTSLQGGKGYESRTSITKEVINALKDDQINIIGICGMAGVGKTRMTHEVRGGVKAENLFDQVAIAVVSGKPNLINIQDQLAEMLGLEFKAKTNVVARADVLRERLLHERNLVILDDVWDVSLDLEEIGLPVRGASKTCKFIFTSRSEQVCTAMGVQRNFEVQVLTDQEAWHLFKEMAGNCVENTEIMLTAKSVAKECGGLPLAIEIVGKALNNKKESVWKDAVGQLRKSSVTNIEGLHKLVYSRIELSYNYLESEQAKKLLLLCCQFPEDCDVPTEYLVRYGVGLHLIEDVDTLAAARNRVDSLVDKLRSCYLLISDAKGVTVKLHDVVRDVCLSIAARGELCYTVRHDYRSKEWLHPNGLDCPNLKLLHLECRLPSKQENDWPRLNDFHGPDPNLLGLGNRPPKPEISGNIFVEMKELRVVCFNDMLVKPPPPSFLVLMNLQTLCLEFCVLGATGISWIGCLRKLEILSFYGSCLPLLPSEIRQLSYLKLLDLRCESGPRMIPKGVLSGLSKLEELYMGDYFQPLDKENRDEGYLESITDINSLPHLTTLQLPVDDHMLLLKLDESCYKRLNRFRITEAWESMKPVNYRFSRSLELYRLDANWVLQTKMTGLLKKTDYLLIESEDLKNLVKEFNKDGFVNLKMLHMYGCGQTEYVIDAYASVAANSTFINLESLNISNMGSLKEICHGDLPAKSFARLEVMKIHNLPMMGHLWKGPISPPSLCNLRVLKMKFCHAIKGLFPESVVKCLVQLQKLSIRGCKMLEEIVVKEGIPRVKDGELIQFPKLRYLKLVNLQSLRSFDPKMDVFAGAVEPFFNQQVLLPAVEMVSIIRLDSIVQIWGGKMHRGFFQKLKVMTVTGCHKLLNLGASDSIELLRNLERLELSFCDTLESVFDCEGLKVRKEHEQGMLDMLESVELTWLSNLTHVWKMVPCGFQGFQNLSSLKVGFCDSLRYLLSHPMAKMLVNLQDLKLERCNKVQVVIGRGEGENSEIVTIDKVDKTIFPRLNSLHLELLENLTTFCYENHDLELPLLKKVLIINCPKLKTSFRNAQYSSDALQFYLELAT